MLRKIQEFLFYNENRATLQKDVLFSTYIAMLYGISPINSIFFSQDDYVPVADLILIAVIFLIGFGIKKYHVYYPRILFIFLVPFLNWMIFDSINRTGVAGALWAFPVISAFFFCFYKNTAFFAIAITLTTTITTSFFLLNHEDFIRVITTTLVSTLCIAVVVTNFYHQYHLLQDSVVKDPLTGLLNRSMLKEVLITSTFNTRKDLQAVLLCFDLDNFKYINDSFGHDVGDKTLINIASLFKQQVRATDSVFRLGGEEFLILLNNINLDNAVALAERIRAEIVNANLTENGYSTSASIGLAIYKRNEEWNAWLKRSDHAMYRAKKAGKNRVVVAD